MICLWWMSMKKVGGLRWGNYNSKIHTYILQTWYQYCPAAPGRKFWPRNMAVRKQWSVGMSVICGSERLRLWGAWKNEWMVVEIHMKRHERINAGMAEWMAVWMSETKLPSIVIIYINIHPSIHPSIHPLIHPYMHTICIMYWIPCASSGLVQVRIHRVLTGECVHKCRTPTVPQLELLGHFSVSETWNPQNSHGFSL